MSPTPSDSRAVQPRVENGVETAEDIQMKRQHARPLAMWSLFLAIVHADCVTLPTWSSSFLDCFRQPSDDQNKHLLRKSLTGHAEALGKIRDYFKRYTAMPVFNFSMSSYLQKCQFHNKAFDDDRHMLEATIHTLVNLGLRKPARRH